MKSILLIAALVVSAPVFAVTTNEVTVQVQDEATAAKAYVAYAAVHSNSYGFQCDYLDERQAMRLAADTATFNCYEAGFDTCELKQVAIIQTGYLGYNKDFDKVLGYGCLAKALIRGN